MKSLRLALVGLAAVTFLGATSAFGAEDELPDDPKLLKPMVRMYKSSLATKDTQIATLIQDKAQVISQVAKLVVENGRLLSEIAKAKEENARLASEVERIKKENAQLSGTKSTIALMKALKPDTGKDANSAETKTRVEKAEPRPTNQTPELSIAARYLYADYKANEVAADKRYKDRVIEVTGRVDNIGKDIMDTMYVTLDTGEMIGSIQCMFGTEHANSLAGLSKGQSVTIQGKCAGKMMNVLLQGCTLK
jgi:hypothetical protein